MLTPFLFELRSVIDWAFTPTSLTFQEWVKVESIYAQVYQIKCARLAADKEAVRGQTTSLFKKVLWGGGISVLLVGALWFPLFLFAYNPVLGQTNVPESVAVTFQIGTYEAEYNMEVMKSDIRQFTTSEWNKLLRIYDSNPQAMIFLAEFEAKDVVAVSLNTNSSSLWNVSPPSLQSLIEELEVGTLTECHLTYKVARRALESNSIETVQHDYKFSLDDKKVRDKLVGMMQKPEGEEPVLLVEVFPKIIQVRNNGKFGLGHQIREF